MTTGQARWNGPARPGEFAASKVPLITGFFWTIKLLSTAMGEATSDYMVKIMNPVIAVVLGFIAFAIAMVLQFRAKRYNAWIYWLAVSMVAVFGTMAADVLHIKFGVPYAVSTTFFAIVLAVVFVVWYRSDGTLSIHSIRTPRRECFYWATVLSTFALGTATGDLTAKTLSLGYLSSGVLFSVAFGAVALAHWKFGLNPITGFWIAYVLTRPVGASFADYVAFPKSVGGLDTGHGPVALTLAAIIVALVGYLAVTRRDVEEVRTGPGGARRGGYPPASRDDYPPADRDAYPSVGRRGYPPAEPGAYQAGSGQAGAARHRRAAPDAGEPWSPGPGQPDRPAQPRPAEPAWPAPHRDDSSWQDQPGPDSPWRDRPRSEPPWQDRPRPAPARQDRPRSSRPRPDQGRPDPYGADSQRRSSRPQRGWDRSGDDAEPEGFFMWDER